jgi:hypothetical protein
VKGERFKEQKEEVKKDGCKKTKQNETLKFEGRIKKEDAMREGSNVSENEKRGLKGEKGENKTFNQMKEH